MRSGCGGKVSIRVIMTHRGGLGGKKRVCLVVDIVFFVFEYKKGVANLGWQAP